LNEMRVKAPVCCLLTSQHVQMRIQLLKLLYSGGLL
jgi:hypothetical protein